MFKNAVYLKYLDERVLKTRRDRNFKGKTNRAYIFQYLFYFHVFKIKILKGIKPCNCKHSIEMLKEDLFSMCKL